MQIKSLFIAVSLFMLVGLSGCVTTSQNGNEIDRAMDSLVFAEPLPVGYQNEVMIARLSDLIYRADTTDDKRARMFFDRGVIYDSVGLRVLARFDFNQAIRLKPDFVEAYNLLGIQFLQVNEFTQAYDAFDSVLELDPTHEYALLNRGAALYYGDRIELAIDDLSNFYQQQTDDPYRIIWLYLAEYQHDPAKAQLNLAFRRANTSDNNWATQILQLFLNEISEQELITNITENVSSNRQLIDRLCEAYFYLGKYHLHRNQLSKAANYFKLALSTNVYEFVEHRYAKLELDLIRETMRRQFK